MFESGINGKADTAKIVDIALVPGVVVATVFTYVVDVVWNVV